MIFCAIQISLPDNTAIVLQLRLVCISVWKICYTSDAEKVIIFPRNSEWPLSSFIVFLQYTPYALSVVKCLKTRSKLLAIRNSLRSLKSLSDGSAAILMFFSLQNIVQKNMHIWKFFAYAILVCNMQIFWFCIHSSISISKCKPILIVLSIVQRVLWDIAHVSARASA